MNTKKLFSDKMRILYALMVMAALTATANAVNFSEIVSLIEETNTLWTPMLNMLTGAAPLIITFAVIAFIAGTISAILLKIKGKF